MAKNLKDKVVLALGSTAIDGYSSIGAAMAHFLRREGAIVLPQSRTADKVRKTIQSLEKIKPLGRRVQANKLSFNTSNDKALTECIDYVEKKFGGIDILINAQGINVKKPTIEMTRKDWESVIEVNLISLARACQFVGERMIERGNGHIINIASETSLLAFPLVAPYGSSKGGVRSLTAHLAAEWARFGVCVNAIAPGVFITDLNRPIFERDPERLQKILGSTPAGRLGDSKFEDLRPVTIFLSTCSSYTNGQIIACDGGMSVSGFAP